ncbi:MAG: NAD(P)H-dependent glycerol-3-phosphate dehydrogenase, partial [Woeseiaceae bacterium]|nr:NAD(P)H-dependent glycerol-3-phosphate dehydrogenase [Woeseiaceae bacterium]NIP22215.1 NAD(P)H-dependent glycerol-3-phosphate dehydrogenase [Woeseiaceae bacterium]
MTASRTFAVVGAGSWGTALALQLARRGCDVRLGGILELDLLEKMAEEGENSRYLPGISFPPNLTAHPDIETCVTSADCVLVVVPSHGLRSTLENVKPLLGKDTRVCWATKGFELHSGKLPHQVAAEVLGSGRPMAVLSGPTFAKEVAEGLPTAMTVAANDEDFAKTLAEALSGDNFRAYTSDDLVGVEVGGAVKNVLAIG